MSIKVLITAGGTVEAIDDVRTFEMQSISGSTLQSFEHLEVANISKGGFGKMIAEIFLQQGVEVTLLARRELCKELKKPPKGLTVKSFRSFLDLSQSLESELLTGDYDIVLMAAAVSDYSPVKIEGKMSSSEDSFSLSFVKNPKLLSRLREWCGDSATLVGFKLLSSVSTRQLIDVAKKQNERAALDFTVANDMQKIDFERLIHPIELVNTSGASLSISGKRQDVATQLVSEILKVHLLKS